MSGNDLVDWKVIENEYIYSPTDISLTEIADKYGRARSAIADKARIGRWFQRRQEYRRQIDNNVMVALASKWAEKAGQVREKVLQAAEATLDAYIKALEKGEIKVDAKDAALMATVLRTHLADIAEAARPTQVVIDGEAEDMSAEEAAQVIEMAKRALRDGQLRLEAGDEATGTDG